MTAPGFVLADLPADALLEAMPDGIVIVDRDGVIVGANTKALSMFGYDWDDLGGRPVEDLVPEELRGKHVRHRAHYHAHPEARAMGPDRRLFARRKDGTTFQVEIGLSPLEHEGHFVVAAVRDVTDRVRLEEDLAKLKRRLDDLL